MKTGTKLFPQLEEGQFWKTDEGHIHICHIGKRLVDYRMMKQPGRKAVRTQATGIDTLAEYLNRQKGVLVNAPSA